MEATSTRQGYSLKPTAYTYERAVQATNFVLSTEKKRTFHVKGTDDPYKRSVLLCKKVRTFCLKGTLLFEGKQTETKKQGCVSSLFLPSLQYHSFLVVKKRRDHLHTHSGLGVYDCRCCQPFKRPHTSTGLFDINRTDAVHIILRVVRAAALRRSIVELVAVEHKFAGEGSSLHLI